MTRIGLVLALISGLAMSACGDGGEPGPSVVGLWGLERGDGCVVAVALHEDGRYRHGIGCQLEGGDVGIERYEGTYVAYEDELDVRLTHSTCAGEALRFSVPYELRGDQLALNLPSARLLLERVESDGTGNGVILNGCWDGDTITFRDLLPLE